MIQNIRNLVPLKKSQVTSLPVSTGLPILDSPVLVLPQQPLLDTTPPMDVPTTHEQTLFVLQVGHLESPKWISWDALVFDSDESPPSPEPSMAYLAISRAPPQPKTASVERTRYKYSCSAGSPGWPILLPEPNFYVWTVSCTLISCYLLNFACLLFIFCTHCPFALFLCLFLYVALL